MNPVLWNRDLIGELSTPLQEDLDQLVANIGTGWAVEHDDQGHHTTVTAATVTAGQYRTAPGGLLTIDAHLGFPQGLPIDVPAGVMFISIIMPAGAWPLQGIRQVGQQFGDRLYVRKDPASSPAATYIDAITTAGPSMPIGCELFFSSEISPVNYPHFRISNSSWTEFIYTPGAGTNQVGAWAIPQAVSA